MLFKSMAGNIRRVLNRNHPQNFAIKYGGRYGHTIGHLVIAILGVIPTYLALALVIPWFSLIRSSARRSDYAYLAQRFPGQNRLQRFFRSTWHIYVFALVLIDQAAAGILDGHKVQIDFPEAESLLSISRKGRGLVLVSCHVGNFLASIGTAHYLDVPTHVVLDTRNYQGNHFFDLDKEMGGFRIIPPTLHGLVSATNALRAGEIVALMGDRKENSRTVSLEFLGKNAKFPITPYHLAYSTGADVAVLLTARTGKLKFRMEFDVIRENGEFQGLDRDAAITAMAGKFARVLEEYVGRYPYMWYNFFDFWE